MIVCYILKIVLLNSFVFKRIFAAYRKDIAILPEILREIIQELLSQSRESSTVKSYFWNFQKWNDWFQQNNVQPDQGSSVKPLTVGIYLAGLIQKEVSVNVFTLAFNGIRLALSVIGVPSPTESELVKNVLEAGKKEIKRAKDKERANFG